MAQKLKIQNSKETATNPTVGWLTWGAALIAVAVWAPVQDPFNAPKQWILLIVGAWMAGQLLAGRKDPLSHQERLTFLLVGAFLASLIFSLLISGFNFTTVFGDYARRTGALTYFALAAIFLVAIRSLRHANFQRLIRVGLISASVIAGYGILQHFGKDFIHWNNPYNSLISTLGNPDFAGAVLGILAVLSFGVLCSRDSSIAYRVWSGLNLIGCLLGLIYSKVFQGFINAAVGIGVLILVLAYQWKRSLGRVFLGLGVIAGAFAFLGIFQKGPLSHYLYKVSVSIRGDYWRAGWRMFTSHIWGGVGLDRYGFYFRQYRDIKQVSRAGAGVVSNAAHSVPVQLGATGGIFVFISYVALTVFIFWRGISALRQKTNDEKFQLSVVFAGWIAFQLQSLVSIDNIGITIWGWLLGGAVLGLSIDGNDSAAADRITTSSKSKKPASLEARYFIGGIFAVGALALCIPLYLSDSAVRQSQFYKPPTLQSQVAPYQAIAKKTLNYGIVEPAYRTIVASELGNSGDIAGAIAVLEKAIQLNPRNYEAIGLLAQIYEQTNKKAKAIIYRQDLVTLDPFNVATYLALFEDQRAVGDKSGASNTSDQLSVRFPNSPEATQAKKELASK
jgi:O-antigen ligase